MDPVSAGFNFASKLTGLFDQLIEDKDLANKLSFEAQKLQFEFNLSLIQTTTSPKVDAFVKLLFAFKDIILPLLRPVGSAAMAGFAAYCATNGVELSETVQVMLFGAPVGWGVSRHVEKKTKAKAAAKPDVWDDD